MRLVSDVFALGIVLQATLACVKTPHTEMPTTKTKSSSSKVSVCPSGYTLCAASGKCYKVVGGITAGLTQAMAEAVCVGEGGHLASITSTAESACVMQLIVAQKALTFPQTSNCYTTCGGPDCGLWIGLITTTPLSNYIWIDASPQNYLNWAHYLPYTPPYNYNEPDNFCAPSNCATICGVCFEDMTETNFAWDDIDCTALMTGYVCSQPSTTMTV